MIRKEGTVFLALRTRLLFSFRQYYRYWGVQEDYWPVSDHEVGSSFSLVPSHLHLGKMIAFGPNLKDLACRSLRSSWTRNTFPLLLVYLTLLPFFLSFRPLRLDLFLMSKSARTLRASVLSTVCSIIFFLFLSHPLRPYSWLEGLRFLLDVPSFQGMRLFFEVLIDHNLSFSLTFADQAYQLNDPLFLVFLSNWWRYHLMYFMFHRNVSIYVT